MKMTKLVSLLLPLFVGSGLVAAPTSFDFKDPKGVNNVVFQLDAPLESINGTATGISGTVLFDPENPASVSGTIVIDTGSMHVGNPTMKNHLHGANWMNVTAHPTMSFEAIRADNVKQEGNNVTADLTGRMTIKGTTREITVPVRLTYLPGMLRQRGGNVDGDLLVLRSRFTVNLPDYNIDNSRNSERVSSEAEISLSLAGVAPKAS
jgi:polyisoprenoid-binding protein YceI